MCPISRYLHELLHLLHSPLHQLHRLAVYSTSPQYPTFHSPIHPHFHLCNLPVSSASPPSTPYIQFSHPSTLPQSPCLLSFASTPSAEHHSILPSIHTSTPICAPTHSISSISPTLRWMYTPRGTVDRTVRTSSSSCATTAASYPLPIPKIFLVVYLLKLSSECLVSYDPHFPGNDGTNERRTDRNTPIGSTECSQWNGPKTSGRWGDLNACHSS